MRKKKYFLKLFLCAETERQAYSARERVVVSYTDVNKPILTVEAAVEAGQVLPEPLEKCEKGYTQGECQLVKGQWCLIDPMQNLYEPIIVVDLC